MKKILNIFLLVLLVFTLTGCNSSKKDNTLIDSQNNEDIEENNKEKTEITYDKVFHCDIEAGIPGSLAAETEGSYYEYYILNNEVVKYIRYQVLPDKLTEDEINSYLVHLEKDRGYKKVERIKNNITITIEDAKDAYEDYNPLPTTVNEVEKMASNNSNCYIK